MDKIQQITATLSQQESSHLLREVLILPYRGLVDPKLIRAPRVPPLIAYNTMDASTREVAVDCHQLIIDLFRG